MRKARDAASAEKDEAEEREADVRSPPSPPQAPSQNPMSPSRRCLLTCDVIFLSPSPPFCPLPLPGTWTAAPEAGSGPGGSTVSLAE